jgi:hypothetical protein
MARPRDCPARFVFEIVTLRRAFYLVDVLLFYLFAMLLAAPALALLERRRWWVLALISGGVWAAYQRYPGALQLPWPIADNPVFNFASWPVLFFAGMILGHSREWLGGQISARRLRFPVGNGWVVLLGLLVGCENPIRCRAPS